MPTPNNPLLCRPHCYSQILGCVRYAKKNGTGMLSTGEACAVALLLNKASLLPSGYRTMLEAVDRINDGSWLEAVIEINRDGLDGWLQALASLDAKAAVAA